jgi:hypothetical protein
LKISISLGVKAKGKRVEKVMSLNESKEPGVYAAVWNDLPLEYRLGLKARRWVRGRTWTAPSGQENVDLKYRREPSTAAFVSEATHAQLKSWLTGVVGVWAAIEDWARKSEASGAFVWKAKDGREGKGISFENTRVGLNAVRNALDAKGLRPGSTGYLARESAAKRAIQVLDGFVRAGRPLAVEQTVGLPGAVSVRLAAGINHSAPVARIGPTNWLLIPGVGSVHPVEGASWPEGIETASYCEAAHIDRIWNFRFVFVSEAPAKARRKAGKVAEVVEDDES